MAGSVHQDQFGVWAASTLYPERVPFISSVQVLLFQVKWGIGRSLAKRGWLWPRFQTAASWKCASAPGLCQELSWSDAVHSLLPEPWVLRGISGWPAHTTFHSWGSGNPGSTATLIVLSTQLEAQDPAPVYLGSQMNWWNFVILDISVEETFSNPDVLWHITAQTIPITSFKSLTPASYKLLNPRSYWQFR